MSDRQFHKRLGLSIALVFIVLIGFGVYKQFMEWNVNDAKKQAEDSGSINHGTIGSGETKVILEAPVPVTDTKPDKEEEKDGVAKRFGKWLGDKAKDKAKEAAADAAKGFVEGLKKDKDEDE